MKYDSKIYRFFFGKRGETRLPFCVMLLMLVPFLIVGLYFQNLNYNALSENPVFTSTVVSKVYSIRNTPGIKYEFYVGNETYHGGYTCSGLTVGDSIGIVYQKDNPQNNMTVFEYYDGPENYVVTIFVIAVIALAIYRWRKINRKYNNRCPELEQSGRCMIYRTDKEYIFVTVYYANSSYPIKFLPLDCDNGAFENTLTDIFHASQQGKYAEIKASELIKAMKQRSWRQLYMHSTSACIHHDGRTLTVEPTKPTTGKQYRELDWDYEHTLLFNLDNASWKEIINSIRNLLNRNETDR